MTIYYECGIPRELVPVEFLGWAVTPSGLPDMYNAVIRLKRKPKHNSYSKGEILYIPAWSVVEKAGIRGGFQRVRPAKLPAINKDKLIKARY